MTAEQCFSQNKEDDDLDTTVEDEASPGFCVEGESQVAELLLVITSMQALWEEFNNLHARLTRIQDGVDLVLESIVGPYKERNGAQSPPSGNSSRKNSVRKYAK